MQRSGIELLFQGQNLVRLLGGLWVSASIALIAMALSIVLGIGLGIVMTSRNWLVTLLTRSYLEVIRIMPQIVLLFLVFFDLARYLGINLDGQAAAIVVFTLWGTAEMGDLVRGALSSLPTHQRTSALALGLTPGQVFVYIEAPQALRRVLPGAINLFTRMVKTTSLAALISVMEVVKVGQQIIERSQMIEPKVPTASFWIYGLIFILYFLVCWPLSAYAARLEKRWVG